MREGVKRLSVKLIYFSILIFKDINLLLLEQRKEMKVLVFDTETTGLPIGRNPSIMVTTSWPHVLQLSYILYDSETKKIIEMQDNLIKISPGVEITPGSEAIHHITRLMCEDRGIDIRDALNNFNKTLDKADVIVGHNISFDKRLLMVECIRTNIRQRFTVNGAKIDEYCTMKRSTELCQICAALLA